MFKKFVHIIGWITLALLIGVLPAYGSGKMEVPIGGQVIFSTDENPSSNTTFKWVVKKEDRILFSKNDRQLQYVFTEQGEYLVTLSAHQNNVIRTTRVLVLAGESYKRRTTLQSVDSSLGGGVYGASGFQGSSEGGGTLDQSSPEVKPLLIHLGSLPSLSKDGRIHLMGDGKVSFALERSPGDLIEYRIDSNIYVDSDNNGVSNDDIDNAGSNSYLTGSPWDFFYKSAGLKQVVAEVTLVDKQGKKVKQQVEIAFDSLPEATGTPVAHLEVSPTPDADTSLSYLYGDKADVAFYARPSTGKILEYRIDRDIFVDSNDDGNPANDIDNFNDSSFKTGDVWQTTYVKTDNQIIAQLIVVGEGGKGSRVQRAFAFTDRPMAAVQPILPKPAIHIEANKEFVLKGDPIEFQVVGLQQSLDHYTFQWDLNGDGAFDKEIEGDNKVQHLYDQTGTFNVKVTIQDRDGNRADRTISVLAKEEIKTAASFSYELAKDGTVTFKNQSIAAANLADKTLRYTWNFADTDESNLNQQQDQVNAENPVYHYKTAGAYRVALTVTDVSGATDETTQEISVTPEVAPGIPTQQPSEPAPSTPTPAEPSAPSSPSGFLASIKSFFNSPLLIKIVKILLYALLSIIALLVILFIGLIVLIKIQHPGLSFDEVIDEMKMKILTIMGIQEHEVEAVAHPQDIPDLSVEPAVIEGEVTIPEEAPAEPEPESEPEPLTPSEEEKPTVELPEESSEPESKKESPSSNQGPIPDWLKNA